jgi:hypothetical protein
MQWFSYLYHLQHWHVHRCEWKLHTLLDWSEFLFDCSHWEVPWSIFFVGRHLRRLFGQLQDLWGFCDLHIMHDRVLLASRPPTVHFVQHKLLNLRRLEHMHIMRQRLQNRQQRLHCIRLFIIWFLHKVQFILMLIMLARQVPRRQQYMHPRCEYLMRRIDWPALYQLLSRRLRVPELRVSPARPLNVSGGECLLAV